MAVSVEFAILFFFVVALTLVNTVTGALGMAGFIQYNLRSDPKTQRGGTTLESFSRMMTPTCEGIFHCLEANSTNPIYVQFNVPPFASPTIFSEEFVTDTNVFTLLENSVIVRKRGVYLCTVLGSVFSLTGVDGEGALILTQLPLALLQSPAIAGDVFHTKTMQLFGNQTVDVSTISGQVMLNKDTVVYLGYQVTQPMALAPGSHMACTLLHALAADGVMDGDKYEVLFTPESIVLIPIEEDVSQIATVCSSCGLNIHKSPSKVVFASCTHQYHFGCLASTVWASPEVQQDIGECPMCLVESPNKAAWITLRNDVMKICMKDVKDAGKSLENPWAPIDFVSLGDWLDSEEGNAIRARKSRVVTPSAGILDLYKAQVEKNKTDPPRFANLIKTVASAANRSIGRPPPEDLKKKAMDTLERMTLDDIAKKDVTILKALMKNIRVMELISWFGITTYQELMSLGFDPAMLAVMHKDVILMCAALEIDMLKMRKLQQFSVSHLFLCTFEQLVALRVDIDVLLMMGLKKDHIRNFTLLAFEDWVKYLNFRYQHLRALSIRARDLVSQHTLAGWTTYPQLYQQLNMNATQVAEFTH